NHKKEASDESRKHVSSSQKGSAQFHPRGKRNLDSRVSCNGDGEPISPILAPRGADIAFERARRQADANQTPWRRFGSVPHQGWRDRAHWGLLPAPACSPLLRARGTRRAGLRLSRLEVRPKRQVHRDAQYTAQATIHGRSATPRL